MFIQRLPTGYVSHPTETSPLASRRESGSGGQLWKKVGRGVNQNAELTKAVKQVNRKLSQLQHLGGLDGKMHPFKIYQMPSEMRATALPDGEAWRTFRVRGGSLFIDVASGTFLDESSNSDGIDQPYYDVFSSRADGTKVDQSTVFEVVCAESTKTYFWIEIVPSDVPVSGNILSGEDPTTNGWASWPEFDCAHILIGWVDTLSQIDQRLAVVRQVLTEDVCVF